MLNQDIFGVDFIVFRKINKFDIFGIVECDKKWLNTLSVKNINILKN